MKVKFKIQGVEFVGEVYDTTGGYHIRLGYDTFFRSEHDVEIIEEKAHLRLKLRYVDIFETFEDDVLNYSTELESYSMSSRTSTQSIQTKFTQEEIKEIKSIYGDIFIEDVR